MVKISVHLRKSSQN